MTRFTYTPKKDLTELCEIAKKHGTDKGGRHWSYGGEHSEHAHEYTGLYHDIFGEDRDDVLLVLEVGVCKGCSLRMWRDYFPKAEIVGLDVDVNYQVNGEERITTFLADGTNSNRLGPILDPYGVFDVIVDDGSHRLEDQINSLRALLPRLHEDGVYIVEDVYEPEKVAAAVPEGFFYQIFDFEGNNDHIVIVMRNGPPTGAITGEFK